jgi:hypothetical protein
MVKITWSQDKIEAEYNKQEQIRAERLRQYEILRKTPPFTVHRVSTVFNLDTREPSDIVTMVNGDVYEGLRKDVSDFIMRKIMAQVDHSLGLDK